MIWFILAGVLIIFLIVLAVLVKVSGSMADAIDKLMED